MKRILIALVLAGFAAFAFAQSQSSTGNTAGNVWSQDHNFTAPPQ